MKRAPKYVYFDVYPTVTDRGNLSNGLPLISTNFVFFSLIIIPYSVQIFYQNLQFGDTFVPRVASHCVVNQ